MHQRDITAATSPSGARVVEHPLKVYGAADLQTRLERAERAPADGGVASLRRLSQQPRTLNLCKEGPAPGTPNLVAAAAFMRHMLASSYPAATAQARPREPPSWPPPGVRCECQNCHVHTLPVAWPDAFACCHNCASRASAPVLS